MKDKLKYSYYNIEFSFFGRNLNELKINKIIGFKATEFIRHKLIEDENGNFLKATELEANFSYEISKKDIRNFYLYFELEKFIDKFKNKIDKINNIKNEFKCSTKIFIPLWLINEEVVSLSITDKVIEFCNKTNTIIEFYLYSFNDF